MGRKSNETRDLKRIATRVKFWRRKAGLTNGQLARGVGVDPSAVTHWETGKASPTVANVEKIARACGVTMRMFWTDSIPGA